MTLSLLEQQIKLENDMVVHGINRYKAAQQRAIDSNRFADTDAANVMIRESIHDLTTALSTRYESATKGRNVRALSILTEHDSDGVRRPRVEADKVMYIALSAALSLAPIRTYTLTAIVISIASRVEDEIRFSDFEEKYGAYYSKIQKGFRERNSTDYRYRHRALTAAANAVDGTGDDWVSWTESDKVLVGTYLLDILLQHTPFFERYSTHQRNGKGVIYRLRISQLAVDLMHKVDSFRMLLAPAYKPMIVPPKPWTAMDSGGYYTARAARRFPFVKHSHKSNYKVVTDIINSGQADRVMTAVNRIQATPWQVNNRVYDTLLKVFRGGYGVGLPSLEPIDIPVWGGDPTLKVEDMDEATLADFNEWRKTVVDAHTAEHERHEAAMRLTRTLDLTQEYKDYDKIYFPHNCDFRGRFYCASSGLSPQGDDIGKACLHFGNSQRINDRGAYWLAVHGANTYGEDKISFDSRREWVITNTEAIRGCAQDPIGNRGFWGNADKPWQFLAFCFEWDGYCRDGYEHRTQLPIALDGSCNGLQHYSALLRDSSGAAATNLINSEYPSDIYKTVADVCSTKVRAALSRDGCKDRELIDFWGDVELSRKLAKKPVMTLPYGSTRLTCADSIQDWLKDKGLGTDALGRQKLSWALTPLLWESIGEVVIAARVCMDWLQKVSREQSRLNKPMLWSTVLGFPISQQTMKTKTLRVRTQLMGATFRPNLDAQTDELCPRKNASGIAPNFTHGNDATHLAMTVLENGECDYAMIHDSFGCHANGIDKLHASIRTAFFDLYSNNDIIQNFIDDTGTEIEPPEYGTYDMSSIHKATYFFG